MKQSLYCQGEIIECHVIVYLVLYIAMELAIYAYEAFYFL
jgi:hypothetical protein